MGRGGSKEEMEISADKGIEVTIDESISNLGNNKNKLELNVLDKLITIEIKKDLTNDNHRIKELRVSQSDDLRVSQSADDDSSRKNKRWCYSGYSGNTNYHVKVRKVKRFGIMAYKSH